MGYSDAPKGDEEKIVISGEFVQKIIKEVENQRKTIKEAFDLYNQAKEEFINNYSGNASKNATDVFSGITSHVNRLYTFYGLFEVLLVDAYNSAMSADQQIANSIDMK